MSSLGGIGDIYLRECGCALQSAYFPSGPLHAEACSTNSALKRLEICPPITLVSI